MVNEWLITFARSRIKASERQRVCPRIRGVSGHAVRNASQRKQAMVSAEIQRSAILTKAAHAF